MHRDMILSEFSRNRLAGEAVPSDIAILLQHRDELSQRTGFSLAWEEGVQPWLDTSYLSDDQRVNPDIAANIRAIEDVCTLIAFVAASEENEYLGYWRGPTRRSIADSPLVSFDNEGQFSLCGGNSLSEAILAQVYDDDDFVELRDWMRSIGINIRWESPADIDDPEDDIEPDEYHNALYLRYQGA